MYISKTPLRISIAGGGTDLPQWCDGNGCMFISAAINKYIYITYHHSFFNPKIRARYSIMEEVDNVNEIKNEIIRESLRWCGIKDSVELTSHAEIPSGTGLGSSGSFGVGLLKVLDSTISKDRLAEESTKIQREILAYPIGIQDQYAATYGGINIYEVTRSGKVKVKPLLTDVSEFESRLTLFYTGVKRDTNEVIRSSTTDGLDRIQELAYRAKEILENENYDEYGKLLNEHWEEKKKRGAMTTPEIDGYYKTAMENGALGGKLVGAGGGGFLMFYTNNREKLIDSLPLQHIPFRFDLRGCRLIND